MAELDVFEARFAAACRRYLDEAPTEVDAAELARTVVALPRARRLPWAATLRMAPAFAWLLLLAGLLVALVGGALLVGSQLQRRLPAILPPVGHVFQCPPWATPDEPGPVDQARPAEEYSAVAFDRRAGRLVVVTIAGDGVQTWTFDVCTNTWTQMHPNQEPPSFERAELAYDVDSDVTIWVSEVATSGVSSTKVWAYHLPSDTWTEKRAAPARCCTSLAYDPVPGLVVAAVDAGTWEHPDRRELWTYDVETDTWTPIDRVDEPGYAAIAYDGSVDQLVAYGDGAAGSPPYETWLFDIRTGSWVESRTTRPPVGAWFVGPRLVYDEAAQRTLVFMRGPLTAYDAAADRWETLAAPELPWEDAAPSVYVYDAVNRRLLGWRVGGNDLAEGAVAALDLVTREWTVLLEPGGRASSTPVPRPEPTSAPMVTPPGGTEEPDLASPVPTASPTSTP